MTSSHTRRRGLRAAWLALLGVISSACAGHQSLAGADGALRPCPSSPNCVSTEATDGTHAMPSIPFTGTPASAQQRARAAVLAEPRTRVVTERPGYLHAESRSRLFRFVDDVEIVIDSATRVIRFRSASRLGRSDMGVNRARMARVTARLHAAN